MTSTSGQDQQQASGPDPAAGMTGCAGLAIVLDKSHAVKPDYRVDAPDRVLRAWAMLNSADAELRDADLPAAAVQRLGRQLEAITAELCRSLSPALARECRLLACPAGSAPADLRELRLGYAGILGWTGGLVGGMLGQLKAARERAAPGERTVPQARE